MSESKQTQAVAFEVKLSGTAVDAKDLVSWVVEQDLGQPDMCTLSVRNEDHRFSGKASPGDTLEVLAGDDKGTVFVGEIVGVEPVYRADGENVCVFRAFNRLHRLSRGRKSRTFLKQSDKDVVATIAGEHGLSANVKVDSNIVHDHLYQHNQTDLEFIRLRAARLGCDVWVDDKKLYFSQAELDKDSGIKLRYGDAGESKGSGSVFIKHFAPRMSAAEIVKKVTVRGWNPEKKEEIVGEATVKSSKLGKKTGSAAAGEFGKTETFQVDHPIFSVDEAKAIAQSKLDAMSQSYIVGEGICRGTSKIKPGIVITATVNPDDAGDRFNGKYFIVGATHRYSNAGVGDTGGYVTGIRFSRDAEGG